MESVHVFEYGRRGRLLRRACSSGVLDARRSEVELFGGGHGDMTVRLGKVIHLYVARSLTCELNGLCVRLRLKALRFHCIARKLGYYYCCGTMTFERIVKAMNMEGFVLAVFHDLCGVHGKGGDLGT